MTDALPATEGHGTGTAARPATRAVGAPRRRRAPSLKVTALAALAGFLVVFELLAFQLRSGRDPEVGSGQLTAQVQPGAAAAGQPGSGSSGALVTSSSGALTAVSQPAQAVSQPAQASVMGARPAQPSSHSVATRTSGGVHPKARSASGDDRFEQEGRL